MTCTHTYMCTHMTYMYHHHRAILHLHLFTLNKIFICTHLFLFFVQNEHINNTLQFYTVTHDPSPPLPPHLSSPPIKLTNTHQTPHLQSQHRQPVHFPATTHKHTQHNCFLSQNHDDAHMQFFFNVGQGIYFVFPGDSFLFLAGVLRWLLNRLFVFFFGSLACISSPNFSHDCLFSCTTNRRWGICLLASNKSQTLFHSSVFNKACSISYSPLAFFCGKSQLRVHER